MRNIDFVTRVAGSMLARRASDGRPVNYTLIARELGLSPPAANWRRHPLRRVFEFLDADDMALHRPLRTVMVINKKSGRPGKGFFRSLAYARHLDLHTESDRERAYQSELAAARLWYSIGHEASDGAPLTSP